MTQKTCAILAVALTFTFAATSNGAIELSATVSPGPSDVSGVDLSGLDIIDVTATSTDGLVASFDLSVSGTLFQSWDYLPDPPTSTPTPSRETDVDYDSYFLLPSSGVLVAMGSFTEDSDESEPYLGSLPTIVDGWGSTLESAVFTLSAESGSRAASMKFLRLMVPHGTQALISGKIAEAVGAGSQTTSFTDFAVGELIELLPGDANGDGQVDGNDLISVEENFGATGDPGLAGDANGDGQVDGNDLISVEENFGATSGAASVPEPTTLLLLGIGGLAALRRRRA